MDLMPVLVVRGRWGATADFLLEAVSERCFASALKPRIHTDAILCRDDSADDHLGQMLPVHARDQFVELRLRNGQGDPRRSKSEPGQVWGGNSHLGVAVL
jgi:hypothetical protein